MINHVHVIKDTIIYLIKEYNVNKIYQFATTHVKLVSECNQINASNALQIQIGYLIIIHVNANKDILIIICLLSVFNATPLVSLVKDP